MHCFLFKHFPDERRGNPPRNSSVGINEPMLQRVTGFKKLLEMHEKGPVSALPGSDPATGRGGAQCGCRVCYYISNTICTLQLNCMSWYQHTNDGHDES